MADGNFLGGVELISPAEFAKTKIQSMQEYAVLSAQAVGNLFKKPLYTADFVQQADLIGFGSLAITVLTGLFTGGALALNSASSLERFGALSLIAQLVSLGMVREIGPVFTAFVVAGRNAAGMASELGSMVVTEQIDAMRALGTDPSKKLVTPRLAATVFMLFFLTVLSDLLGFLGGALVASAMFGLDWHEYWTSAWEILTYSDVFMGLIKPVLFGFIIATIGCYFGMSARGGTQGVGRATTQAVVYSLVLILVVDFFLTRLLMITLGFR